MSKTLQIRDPIHNFILLNEEEGRLIDTGVFQRLRGIRQLALATLVYPGALHTRFDHSIGVMHVASMMSQQLHLTCDAIELIRYAALLHDIGHGPFSHVSEYALDLFGDRSSLPEGHKREKIHELLTGMIIKTDPQISKILGKDRCRDIVKMLSTGHGERARKAVVSGPLDADKQDYLLRDSHFCGVRYGLFDICQFHRSLVAVPVEDTVDVMIDPASVHAVEQYVMAKYYMTANVYRHKVRLITDQMIIRAITLGISKDEIAPLRGLYAFDASCEFVNNYCKWDDARFMLEFGGSQYEGKKCHHLLERLRKRQLLKRVFRERPKEFPPEVREVVIKLSNISCSNVRERIERAIAAELSQAIEKEVEPDFVILHAYSIKSAREMSLNDEVGILVKAERPSYFVDKSSLFASIQKGFDEQFVEVYAPVQWSTREERADLCERLHGPICDIIKRLCRQELEGTKA